MQLRFKILILAITLIMTLSFGYMMIGEVSKLSYKDCVTNDDCVRVRSDCCGCELGGLSTYINKQYKQDYEIEKESLCVDETQECSNVSNCVVEPVLCIDGSCQGESASLLLS